MTLSMTPPDGETAEAPAGADGRLARLHLGTGLLRLARVELEELAGEGRLNAAGVLDLAEARWRTGDLRGAAEAAGAWLEAGAATGETETGGRAVALAHALVADALTVRGRDDEAAAHVAATLAALAPGLPGEEGSPAAARSVSSALDALFAGIAPRADAWPAFDLGDRGAASADRVSAGGAVHAHASYAGSATPNLMAAAADRLGAGDDAAAAVLLILALRASPIRAQEVLERADAALAARSSAGLLLARAEALRVLGRHEAAGIAYAVADAYARGVAPAVSPAPGPDPTDPPVDHDAGTDAAAAPDPEWSPE
jgi:hypothetical protein